MVNMYSMGMMGGGMYGMNPMGGMYGMGGIQTGSAGNEFENLRQRYGCGHADFGVRPYATPYPYAITPQRPESPSKKGAISRFFNLLFN